MDTSSGSKDTDQRETGTTTSDGATMEESSGGSTLEKDLKSIINKLSPLLGPLPTGQSRKVKYEKGGTAVEIKVPIGDKDKYYKVDKIEYQSTCESEAQLRLEQCREERREMERAGREQKERIRREQEIKRPITTSDGDSSTTVPKTSNSNLPTGGDTSMSSVTESSKYKYGDAKTKQSETHSSRTFQVYDQPQIKRGLRDGETIIVEPEAKKVCPISFQQSSAAQPNVDRYNCNHIAYGRPKRKIKWSNYIPSFPSVPGSVPMLSDPRSKNVKNEGSNDSGVTLPQLYKANVATGPFPQKFTFKAVTGAQDNMSEQLANQFKNMGQKQMYGEPYGSHIFVAPEMQHYPRLKTHNPYVRAGPVDPLTSDKSKNKETNKKTDIGKNPSNTKFPPNANTQSNQSVLQRICDECHKLEFGSNSYSRDYEVNPEKARAFLGEKGEGYISVNTIPERVDVYCFDQLNTGFFRTSDHPPPLIADVAIETTEAIATRFWAELFGLLHIIFAFFMAMFLQCFKFILTAIVRPILIGFVQLFSDYFIKPLLTVIYNGFTQPISVCLYNVFASLRDIMNPIAKGLGYFIEPFANLIRAFRLVEVKNTYYYPQVPRGGIFDPAGVPLLPGPVPAMNIT